MTIASLKGDRAFQRLRKGRAGHANYLSTRWMPDQNGQVRVGIVVNKQVGKAVVRNRVRRRLREALRVLMLERSISPEASFKGNPSFALVVIARPEAAQADFQQLKDALAHALKKGKLLL